MKDRTVPPGYVVVSFDVVSLFTSIPLDLVISIIVDEWDRVARHTTIHEKTFVELLEFVCKNTYFSYDNNFYRQKFGTPMGSTISPILAEITVNYLLKRLVATLPFNLAFVYQYVDDVIASLPQNELNFTLQTLNGLNQHIQFTMEEEQDCSILI